MIVFTSVSAQFDNIGDAHIRRLALSGVEQSAQIFCYTGPATPDYVESVDPTSRCTLFHSRIAWTLELIRNIWRSPTLLFLPGEYSLRNSLMKHEILMLIITALVRIFGGRVIRVARSVRQADPICLWTHRFACRISSYVSWRDFGSRDMIGFGEVVPDISLAQPLPSKTESSGERDRVSVVLRGDPPSPPDNAWYVAVHEFCRLNNLDIVVVVQVRRDEEFAQVASKKLNASLVSWTQGVPHSEQEDRVRRVLSRSRYIIGDRLHGLLIGVEEGAFPLAVVQSSVDKIRLNFAPFDLDICSLVAGFTSGEILDEFTRLQRIEEHGGWGLIRDGRDASKRSLDKIHGFTSG